MKIIYRGSLPSFVARTRFMAQCQALDQQGIAYSVGMVGLKEHFNEIALLRRIIHKQNDNI
jgi:hypothetical protein